MTSCTQSWERAILPDLCLLAPGGPSLFQSIIVSLRVTIATFVHALVDSPCFHLPYCILFGYLYSAERAVHGDSPANSLPVSQSLCVKGQMYPPITLGLYMFPPYCGYVHFFPYLLPHYSWCGLSWAMQSIALTANSSKSKNQPFTVIAERLSLESCQCP